MTGALVVLRRTLERADPRRAARLDRRLAIVTAAVWLLGNIFWMLPPWFALKDSLPLHVCDLIGVVAPIALFSTEPRRSWPRALLYFGGLGLCTQALITPTLDEGPARPEFWCFFGTHFAVIGAAIYDLLARGFRPGWRDLRVGIMAGLGYAAVLLPFDLVTGLNYGYVGSGQPENPTVLDALGPWPLRLLWIALLVSGLMFGMTWPWELAKFIRGRRITRQVPPDAGRSPVPAPPRTQYESRTQTECVSHSRFDLREDLG